MPDDLDLEGHSLAEVLPLMGGTAFEELVQDIQLHGQRDPITLYVGKILDGRNRYQACRILGIECRTEAWDGRGSSVAFVVSKILRRRDLNESQRSVESQAGCSKQNAYDEAGINAAKGTPVPGRDIEVGRALHRCDRGDCAA